MTAPELNPATGRPYRLRSLRKRLAGAARERTEQMLGRQLEGAEARRDAARRKREADGRPSTTPVRVPVRVRPDEDRKPRDRTLRGKDRIRARKAARREAR